jgi:hypothetical protein
MRQKLTIPLEDKNLLQKQSARQAKKEKQPQA